MSYYFNTSCNAYHITWHPQGYQCLNCGAVASHSWEIKHRIVKMNMK